MSNYGDLRRLQGLIDDCAIYLKEGETPAERIARDHRDSLALMTLLAREKRKTETLLEALAVVLLEAEHTLLEPTRRKARAAIKAVEENT